MELLKVCFFVGLVLVVLPEVYADCHTNECECSPDIGDGSMYPTKPLRWGEFESLFEAGQPLPYLELYNLHPVGQIPALSKVVVQWANLNNSQYINYVAGWIWQLGNASVCYEDTILFTRNDIVRFHEDVTFYFDILLPERVPYVGTMISSCPSRYLINWYCPVDELEGKVRCRSNMRISLTAPNGPENVPWHLVNRDLCRNNAPFIDDKRWHFTYFAEQCEITTQSNMRRKRDVSKQTLWP